MTTLFIDLREGFENDEVIVNVDGKEVYRREEVKTRYQLGLADEIKMPVAPDGTVAIEVLLPRKNLSQQLTVPISGDTYVGVSVARDGSLECQWQAEPFFYM